MLILADTGILLRLVDPAEPLRPPIEGKVIGTLAEHAATRPNWRKLVVTHQVRGKQVHDARLAASMIAHGITHILTLNGADFARYPQLTVIDPTDTP